MIQYANANKQPQKNNQKELPLKELNWLPELKYACRDWQIKLEEAQKQVKHYKEAIKNTKAYIKETEANRPQLFAQIMAEFTPILDAYMSGRAPFNRVERKQIYEVYNQRVISALIAGEVRQLKNYIWATETHQKNKDWEYIVRELIEWGDVEKIKNFQEIKFERFPKKIKQKLVEYIESRSLAEYMAEPK